MSHPQLDDDLTEVELISYFLASRDESAFRLLYARHTPKVYGLLRQLTAGTAIDISDVVQETWIRAIQNLNELRGNSQFRTWLTGIALNCWRERRRSERLRACEALEDVSEPTGEVSTRSADVQQCLYALAPEQRAILILHDVEGYTHEQIAPLLGIEPGTSKSRLSRARDSFRTRWG